VTLCVNRVIAGVDSNVKMRSCWNRVGHCLGLLSDANNTILDSGKLILKEVYFGLQFQKYRVEGLYLIAFLLAVSQGGAGHRRTRDMEHGR
jgi:hypothetical protein